VQLQFTTQDTHNVELLDPCLASVYKLAKLLRVSSITAALQHYQPLEHFPCTLPSQPHEVINHGIISDYWQFLVPTAKLHRTHSDAKCIL